MDLWFWGILFVLTVVAEIASQQLISIWFAAGSLVALIVALFGAPIWLQALLFVAVSALLLLLTRSACAEIYQFCLQRYQSAVRPWKIWNRCADG